MESILEAFTNGQTSASTSTNVKEEKSTIDKVFEELDEAEGIKPEGNDSILKNENHPEETQTQTFGPLTERPLTEISDDKDASEDKITDGVSINLLTVEAVNLMEHIDLRRSESIKTKEGIDLTDLLENGCKDVEDLSKSGGTLLDCDPLEMRPVESENLGSSDIATEVRDTSRSAGQSSDTLNFRQDSKQLEVSTAMEGLSVNTSVSTLVRSDGGFDLNTAFPESALEFPNGSSSVVGLHSQNASGSSCESGSKPTLISSEVGSVFDPNTPHFPDPTLDSTASLSCVESSHVDLSTSGNLLSHVDLQPSTENFQDVASNEMYHINHLPGPESENSFDGGHFTPYNERLSSQFHHNQDFPRGDFSKEGFVREDLASGDFTRDDFGRVDFVRSDLASGDFARGDLGSGDFDKGDFASGDFNVDPENLLSKYKQMEAQQEMLNHSLISLSTHFAQVQLRLKQIINSPKEEQEALLKNLEKFTFIGIPEVNELCLYNYDASETETDKANKSYIEDKIVFEKNKHKEMIGKLKAQLEALENYVYEFSNNDLSEIPTNQIISKQQVIINELKDKLNLNVNLEEAQLKDEVNKSIIHPMKTKEDLILQLKTQISDLETFINFLQSTQCKCSGEGQVDMKNKTISIMKKISTILHIFAEHHSSGFKKPATVAAMKKSMKVNHYGDLRAQLEIAINHVMDACRQPPDQDLPDSDYMSDTEEQIPCNSKVALAVRKHLCPTLQRLLQHGLSSLNATQTVSVVQYISCVSARRSQTATHIWDLIEKYYQVKDGADFNCKPNRKLSESFNLDIGSGSLGIKQSLLASIGNILSIHHKYKKFNPDSYFKSFVCDGLNKKLLVEWLLLILNYKTLASEVYASWSYVVATQFSDAAQSLRRLYEFHFSLTIVDVTIRNLQSIKDAF